MKYTGMWLLTLSGNSGPRAKQEIIHEYLCFANQIPRYVIEETEKAELNELMKIRREH
jgi:hypothetical protein